MQEKVFNLLNEHWILATDVRGASVTLSLIDVFSQAHNIKTLSGELPTQDTAVLRLLLAILHANFTRVDEMGKKLVPEYDAIALWNRLWLRKCFPMDIIKPYLEQYYERFWLVHPQWPFWQVAGQSKGTPYGTPKLMGDLSESNHKSRLFQNRSGNQKDILSYAEAVRWLLHLNCFDDNSSKPTRDTGQKMPRPGAGWLGKLGIVYAAGENLFETLMLNLVLLDDNGEHWEDEPATWELKEARGKERVEIPMPNSQISLLTLQSRRILLIRSDNGITGYTLLGGDFFPKENAFVEQMTLWRFNADKEDIYVPKRHDPAKQFWRDFSALMAKREGDRRPGVVSWLEKLIKRGLITKRQLQLRASSVKYGDSDYFVTDLMDDSVSINALLLSSLGDKWVIRITELLQLTDKALISLGYLAQDIALASGVPNGDTGKKRRESARQISCEDGYFRLDIPFRSWLSSINPESDNLSDKCDQWLETARHIILQLGEEIVSRAGSGAFVGREVKMKSKEQKRRVTSPEAYKKFKGIVRKILKTTKEAR